MSFCHYSASDCSLHLSNGLNYSVPKMLILTPLSEEQLCQCIKDKDFYLKSLSSFLFICVCVSERERACVSSLKMSVKKCNTLTKQFLREQTDSFSTDHFTITYINKHSLGSYLFYLFIFSRFPLTMNIQSAV